MTVHLIQIPHHQLIPAQQLVDTTAASASPDSPKRPDPPSFEKQGDAVRHEKSKYTPKNTKFAYNSKAKEFQGYMQSVYGGRGDKDTCLTITPSKVFSFMYYQCYRKKRATNSESGKFDRVEYDTVLAKPNETEGKVDLL